MVDVWGVFFAFISCVAVLQVHYSTVVEVQSMDVILYYIYEITFSSMQWTRMEGFLRLSQRKNAGTPMVNDCLASIQGTLGVVFLLSLYNPNLLNHFLYKT